ncbi:MAG: hypothetical protein IKW38_01140 [Kiritimatiellae bacterium]|jgi:hypothetical protein|nr:hypothetical protein [Kiritimatiellia bacterium]
MSSDANFTEARRVAETWLTACQHREVFADAPGYVAWTYVRDARHAGTLELIDDPEISQGKERFALSVALELPPVQSVEDALALFNLADWLDGITVVTKEFGAEGGLMLQLKGALAELTEAKLAAASRALAEAKAFFEEI